jgi:hypothetical protein
MTITKLQGGLGNQLFQYALGRHVAYLCGTSLAFDISSFGNEGPNVAERTFKLGAFTIDARVASWTETLPYTSRILRKLFHTKKTVEKSFHFDPGILQSPANTYLEGYWQSWKYVEPIQDIVRKEVVLKEPLGAYYAELAQQAKNVESVAIHIRRQDYITDARTSAYHGVLLPSYYQDAVEALKAKGVQNPTYIIFSDDIPWCRKHVQLGGIMVFCDPPTAIDTQELMVMSACKHFIIANSSFSWWAAWLNPSPQKIVIAPKRWTNDPKDGEQRIAPGWFGI